MDDQALRAHKATHDKSNSWWLNDYHGIPVSRVCDICEEHVKAQYHPAVFGEDENLSYEDVVEEQIDDDY